MQSQKFIARFFRATPQYACFVSQYSHKTELCVDEIMSGQHRDFLNEILKIGFESIAIGGLDLPDPARTIIEILFDFGPENTLIIDFWVGDVRSGIEITDMVGPIESGEGSGARPGQLYVLCPGAHMHITEWAFICTIINYYIKNHPREDVAALMRARPTDLYLRFSFIFDHFNMQTGVLAQNCEIRAMDEFYAKKASECPPGYVLVEIVRAHQSQLYAMKKEHIEEGRIFGGD